MVGTVGHKVLVVVVLVVLVVVGVVQQVTQMVLGVLELRDKVIPGVQVRLQMEVVEQVVVVREVLVSMELLQWVVQVVQVRFSGQEVRIRISATSTAKVDTLQVEEVVVLVVVQLIHPVHPDAAAVGPCGGARRS